MRMLIVAILGAAGFAWAGDIVPPRISSISPGFGSYQGGTRISLRGSDFSSVVNVIVGGLPCEDLAVYSPEALDCTVPRQDSGPAQILFQTMSGRFFADPQKFFYVLDDGRGGSALRVSIGKTKQVRVNWGRAPFKYSVYHGEGTINEKGVYSAPLTPGAGLIRVEDADGRVGEVPFSVYAALQAFPEQLQAKPDELVRITATGGNPLYSLAKKSGGGRVVEGTMYFHTPLNPGKTALVITDSLGNSADVSVTVEAGFDFPQRKLAAGDDHTCSLRAGKVFCWGSNTAMQLGNSLIKYKSNVPVRVADLDDEVVSIASGLQHSCALTRRGALKCWGDNRFGQLGDGTRELRQEPVQVLGLETGVSAVALGDFHSCAIVFRKLFCWGSNNNGQLGDEGTADRPLPVNAHGVHGRVTALAGGAGHTCVVENDRARCWGLNRNGQLGTGNRVPSLKPVDVPQLGVDSSSAMVAGHGYTCALLKNGSVWCWGFAGLGSAGNVSPEVAAAQAKVSPPVQVSGLSSGVTRLASGQYHNCAIFEGGLHCWGYNYQGQLGNGNLKNSPDPVRVQALGALVMDVAAGSNHTCALLDNDEIFCWGGNDFGQLGDGTVEPKRAPSRVLFGRK